MSKNVPEIFKDIDAAKFVRRGYDIEEDVPWTILEMKINNTMFYKPCRVSDYTYEVKAEGWVISY